MSRSASLSAVFCPSCKDEFRPGFSRCANCEVDLVDELGEELDSGRPSAQAAPSTAPISGAPVPAKMADYCGFFSLDEAREARDQLAAGGLDWEIAVRPSAETPSSAESPSAVAEEYWLRIDVKQGKEAAALLAVEPAPANDNLAGSDGDADLFRCGDCGHEVRDGDDVCPGCGARFDD